MPSHTAIIIEPRRHKALWFVLENVLQNLSEDWKIVLFHGIKNENYAQDVAKKLNTSRLQLVKLPVDNLNGWSYSKYLSQKSIIYDYIDTKYFLVFQTDSMILKKNKHKMNEFLEMDIDYVGGPWKVTNYFLTHIRGHIGNGGFSLRKTSAMKNVMEVHPWDPGDIWHEDLYFTRPIEGHPLKKPAYDKAKEFCVDEVFHEEALAVHKPWDHEHYNNLKDLYPEIEILRQLQGVE
jgi:hypothetical protein